MISDKKMLVFSAHSGDFVWRAGGTIAKYIKENAEVHLVVFSFGIRGESNDLWKQDGQTSENVKETRQEEVQKAAEVLGIHNIELWDFEDYPMFFDRERLDRIAKKIRKVRPDIILTHDKHDAFNPDHNAVHEAVFNASVISNSAGAIYDGLDNTKQMRLFGFEPHQTEISGYVPGSFIDITSTYDQKVKAMQCFRAQPHLIEYYTQHAFLRGYHARRISGNNSYKYAESFSNFFPVVGQELF
jgi:4-oxalomesaconate hydratase